MEARTWSIPPHVPCPPGTPIAHDRSSPTAHMSFLCVHARCRGGAPAGEDGCDAGTNWARRLRAKRQTPSVKLGIGPREGAVDVVAGCPRPHLGGTATCWEILPCAMPQCAMWPCIPLEVSSRLQQGCSRGSPKLVGNLSCRWESLPAAHSWHYPRGPNATMHATKHVTTHQTCGMRHAVHIS